MQEIKAQHLVTYNRLGQFGVVSVAVSTALRAILAPLQTPDMSAVRPCAGEKHKVIKGTSWQERGQAALGLKIFSTVVKLKKKSLTLNSEGGEHKVRVI